MTILDEEWFAWLAKRAMQEETDGPPVMLAGRPKAPAEAEDAEDAWKDVDVLLRFDDQRLDCHVPIIKKCLSCMGRGTVEMKTYHVVLRLPSGEVRRGEVVCKWCKGKGWYT